MFIFVSILAAISTSIAIFFGTEFLKKWRFMRDFITSSNQLVTFNYEGGDKALGMQNIVRIVLSGSFWGQRRLLPNRRTAPIPEDWGG